MYETAALRKDFLPAAGLLRELGFAEFEQLNRRLRDRIELGRLRKEAKSDLEEVRAAAAWLTEHSESPAPDDLDPNWLAEAAGQAQEKERQVAMHFRPVVAALRSELGPPNDEFEAEVQQLLRDSIEILEGWMTFYEGLYIMLARQTGEQHASGQMLRARPVTGEIDHAGLSREFMERFPNIRAALAK